MYTQTHTHSRDGKTDKQTTIRPCCCCCCCCMGGEVVTRRDEQGVCTPSETATCLLSKSPPKKHGGEEGNAGPSRSSRGGFLLLLVLFLYFFLLVLFCANMQCLSHTLLRSLCLSGLRAPQELPNLFRPTHPPISPYQSPTRISTPISISRLPFTSYLAPAASAPSAVPPPFPTSGAALACKRLFRF